MNLINALFITLGLLILGCLINGVSLMVDCFKARRYFYGATTAFKCLMAIVVFGILCGVVY